MVESSKIKEQKKWRYKEVREWYNAFWMKYKWQQLKAQELPAHSRRQGLHLTSVEAWWHLCYLKQLPNEALESKHMIWNVNSQLRLIRTIALR